MPWASEKQMRWGNSSTGRRKLGAAKVAEFNAATKGKKLVAAAPKKGRKDGAKKMRATSPKRRKKKKGKGPAVAYVKP